MANCFGQEKPIFLKITATLMTAVFVFTSFLPPAYAQNIFLPPSGTMLNTSQGFVPTLFKGLVIHNSDPLHFDFIIDTGNTKFTEDQVKEESKRLLKYFLAAMTIPQDNLWVNLSPYEENRIIPDELGKTSLGRDMLAQDYLLKQLTATMFNPEKDLGKKFWDKVRRQVQDQYGMGALPADTFSKVWIVPEKVVVYENGNAVYITESRLKIMMEEDYLAGENGEDGAAGANSQLSKANDPIFKRIMEEIIVPAIEQEVNEGKNFAPIRQVYHSLILAQWYKETIKESLWNAYYIDQKKITGVGLDDPTFKDQIYDQYMQAFKQGVFTLIKEDYDDASQQVIPRQYFAGGEEFDIKPEKRQGLPSEGEAGKVGTWYLESVDMRPLVVTGGKSSGNTEGGDKAMVTTTVSPTLDFLNAIRGLNAGSFEFYSILVHQFQEMRSNPDNKETLVIGENFFPSAIEPRKLPPGFDMEELLPVYDYEKDVLQYIDSIRRTYKKTHTTPEFDLKFNLTMVALDAGLGTSVVRDEWLWELAYAKKFGRRVSLGAKGTDLGYIIDGKFVSISEVKLLRLIQAKEEGDYTGDVDFKPIVSAVEDSKGRRQKIKGMEGGKEIERDRTTYDELFELPVFGQKDPKYTYAKKLKKLGITVHQQVVEGYPSLKPRISESGDPYYEITFDRTSSVSHSEWGFKFLREALLSRVVTPKEHEEQDIAEVPELVAFYNGDGTNNAPDSKIMRWAIAEQVPVTMVSTTKTGIDKKGGQFGVKIFQDEQGVWQFGGVRMLERASAEENGQAELFDEMGLTKGLEERQYFNTNIAVLNKHLVARILQILLDKQFDGDIEKLEDLFTPDLIRAVKPKGGIPYIQLEGAIGTVFLKVHNYFETHPDVKARVNAQLEQEGYEPFTSFVRIVNAGKRYRTRFFTAIKKSVDFWLQAFSNFYQNTKIPENKFRIKSAVLTTTPPELDLQFPVQERETTVTPEGVMRGRPLFNAETGKPSIKNWYDSVTAVRNALGEKGNVINESANPGTKDKLDLLVIRGLVDIHEAVYRGRVMIINLQSINESKALILSDREEANNLTAEDIDALLQKYKKVDALRTEEIAAHRLVNSQADGRVILKDVFIKKDGEGNITMLPYREAIALARGEIEKRVGIAIKKRRSVKATKRAHYGDVTIKESSVEIPEDVIRNVLSEGPVGVLYVIAGDKGIEVKVAAKAQIAHLKKNVAKAIGLEIVEEGVLEPLVSYEGLTVSVSQLIVAPAIIRKMLEGKEFDLESTAVNVINGDSIEIESVVKKGKEKVAAPKDEAMVVKVQDPTLSPTGGIDFDTIGIEREGDGVYIEFDPIFMQHILTDGVDGFIPVIINLTPINSIFPILGHDPADNRMEELALIDV